MSSSRPMLSSRAVRAHALKNCLTVIVAVNRLVESEVGEANQQRLRRSKTAVRRMVELIDADLKPVEGGVERRGSEFVTSAEVLNAVRVLVEDLAQTKEIQLEFRVGSGGVHGHFLSLVDALGNIVKNAIESSSAGGAVIVTSSESAGGGQLWTVRDTGPGIPPHVLPFIGRPYFTQRTGGSGLGVAIARDTVASHGGGTEFESAPDGGTLVSMWLPPVSST